MTNGSGENAAEKDVDEYAKAGQPQQINGQGGGKDDRPDDKNWLAMASSIQHLKEAVVILSAAGVLVWLLIVLTSLMNSIISLFQEAVRLHSAPVTVVKTMDWHVLGLGVSLIIGVSAISIILLKSVFGGGKQTPDGLKLSDLPVGEFLESLKSWFKK
ncbi:MULTISPECIES: hypothetical protein [Pseudomonas]|uniref:Uncharacterized protein n=1 Tax=Pseudomonas juntendi TaxID=2666183 RepID=A0A7W2LVZ4_9PSED|nr:MULTISPECIES: hypothetical protein [Pseudomonas]EGB96779.1 hypothetical protein G1E_21876 [Pseudomonas sp. TJI-51]MBA6132151.1 hypothetical protein [Pseudomonas juntendi]MBA6148022.1 hypothetical protein [Pseudomonas juntendi]MBI6913513.1 hypothetical protein [Pseudomonas juntendi]MCK2110695.1 hypothetical protein [Pseudomonas juntendi]